MGPDPAPFAIAGTMEFPWEAAGVPQKVRFDLLDDQGKPVMNGDPSGRSRSRLMASGTSRQRRGFREERL